MEQQTQWIVVTREVRNTTSRGRIVKAGLSEASARQWAKELAAIESMRTFNVWAMPRESY
jgi:hypothetical protein